MNIKDDKDKDLIEKLYKHIDFLSGFKGENISYCIEVIQDIIEEYGCQLEYVCSETIEDDMSENLQILTYYVTLNGKALEDPTDQCPLEVDIEISSSGVYIA